MSWGPDGVDSGSPRQHARRLASLAIVATLAAILPASAAHGSGSEVARNIFAVAFAPPEQLDTVDPALSNTQAGWTLLDATCARLLRYADANAPAAFRLVPDVAAREPVVSRDGRTYTFTLRTGFRFSDGAPVRASAFARAINRALAPAIASPGVRYMRDIVGADDVLAGRASAAAGVVARGNRLVIRLKQPAADFPARTTMPYFCAVPPRLPADPEGLSTFSGSGPYYVSEFIPGRRVVLDANRFYGGRRSHHVAGFDVDLTLTSPQQLLDRTERGEVDWGIAPPPIYFAPDRQLAARYGVNRSQFFVKPGFTFRGFALNTARPLFKDNVPLRRAVNFAVDRAAIQQYAGGDLTARVTDQYLPPSLPGFRDAQIYPLGRPDLARARALAQGHTRGGQAILYTYDIPLSLGLAQIVKENLAQIGLDVTIEGVPVAAYEARLSAPGEPYDLAFVVTPSVDYLDPYPFLNRFFAGRFIGSTNWSNLDSPLYNRLLDAAARLRGDARQRVYGDLDVRLARDAAPMIAQAYANEPTLVSTRVGCVVLRPALDLTVACLH
jgi:peptide/nickel transport system substrate-binding protein